LSASVALTFPVTTPVVLLGLPTLTETTGILLAGRMFTVTVAVAVAPLLSITVTVNVSVVRSAAALTVAAACRAAAVGV
jgi:hypothetical protein